MREASIAQPAPLRRALDWSLFLGGAAGLGWYLYYHGHELERLRALTTLGLAEVAALIFATHLLASLELRILARSFGAPITHLEAFWLTEIGGLMNLVPVGLGTVVRAMYLKREHGLAYTGFGAGFLGSKAASMVASGGVGLVAMLALGADSGLVYSILALYLVGPLAMLVAARMTLGRSARAHRWLSRVPGVARRLDGLRDQLGHLTTQRAALSSWLVLHTASNLMMGARYWLLGRELGLPYSFLDGTVVQCVGRLSTVLTFIPSGAIGFREGLSGLAASELGAVAIGGVLIAVVDRAIAAVLSIVLGPIGSLMLRRRAQASDGRTS